MKKLDDFWAEAVKLAREAEKKADEADLGRILQDILNERLGSEKISFELSPWQEQLSINTQLCFVSWVSLHVSGQYQDRYRSAVGISLEDIHANDRAGLIQLIALRIEAAAASLLDLAKKELENMGHF